MHHYYAFKRIIVSINWSLGVRTFFINHGSLAINIFALFLLFPLLHFSIISFELKGMLFPFSNASTNSLPHLQWDLCFFSLLKVSLRLFQGNFYIYSSHTSYIYCSIYLKSKYILLLSLIHE